jgi:endonuclease/exonuclease/phosphatase family metal-dependent hydrolase
VRGRIQANAMIWNSRRVGVERFDHLRLAGGKGFYKQERNSVVVEASCGRLSVLAYSVHLDIFGAAHKREQLANIFQDRLLRPPAAITVVAGDLNLFHLSRWPSWSTVIQAYEADGFADAARSVRWTHSARPLPIRQKLDSILVRSSLTLELESWTIPLRGSDHIPLFANLEPH